MEWLGGASCNVFSTFLCVAFGIFVCCVRVCVHGMGYGVAIASR